MSIADTLEAAAKLIEPEGAWTQGVWGDANSCMCAEGAIYAAVGRDPMRGRESIADGASKFLAKLLPFHDGNAIAHWNDAPERTQAEVVIKLREAAAKAREQGL